MRIQGSGWRRGALRPRLRRGAAPSTRRPTTRRDAPQAPPGTPAPARPDRSNARRRPTRRTFTASRASTSCGIASTGRDRQRRRRRLAASWSDASERLELFATPRDWLRYAVGRFRAARPRLRPRRDDGARRGRLSHPRGAAPPDRHARSVPRRAGCCAASGERLDALIEARVDDAQARRLSPQPRLHPGRAVLRRRARHRAAQLHRRTPDDGARRGQRADRRSGGGRRASSTCARAAARSPSSPRASFPTRRSTRSTCRPTRSRSPGATSRSTGSPTASGSSRAICSQPLAGRALRPDPDQSALCRRGGGRRLSARIRGRAAHGPCRRRGRARHRAADSRRGAASI